jgi:GNAT superfamily N-acetyltransferase
MSTFSLDVRKAQPADAQALADILTQAMKFKLAQQDEAWGSEPYTTGQLRERINRGNTYAAWYRDEIIATLVLIWEDEMMWGMQPPVAAYFHQLAIKDGYHGLGVGSQLLNWAGEQATRKGRTLLRLDFPPKQ